jgi:hypothetical protein
MAPKLSKAMKVMKVAKDVPMKEVMKKPAGKSAVDQGGVLTELALKKLEGGSDRKVEEFLDVLQDKEQMRLWKKFESTRKEEGVQDDWKMVTGGAGKVKTSRHLLKVFIQSGLTTKSPLYQDAFAKVSTKLSAGQTKVWQPLHYMLQHKFGLKELKARVLAGTIAIRACPDDPRFPEFCEVSNWADERTSKETATTIQSHKMQGASWEDFTALQQVELSGGSEITFGARGGSEDPLALTGWTSSKARPSPSPSPSPPASRSAAGSGVGSVASMIVANIANSEALITKSDPKDVRLALIKCKGAFSSLIASLEEKSLSAASKKEGKQFELALKEVKATHRALEKPGTQGLSPGQMKQMVTKAAKLARKHSDLIED